VVSGALPLLLSDVFLLPEELRVSAEERRLSVKDCGFGFSTAVAVDCVLSTAFDTELRGTGEFGVERVPAA